MNLHGSIRKDAVRLRSSMSDVINEWRAVLYRSGYPCSGNITTGNRIELSQIAKRLTLIEAAAAVLDKAVR